VASPMILLAALGVRLEGGPGVIFRQQRIGLDGRPFTMLKLRSLTPGDEQESEERWSIAQEKKVGPVGRFLRRTSIDELPQLLNVLRGDMSIVGPRPERPYFVREFAGAYPHYMARHRLPSGLTGWAQVNGLRGNTSIEDRARFDNAYIENWSLWLDIKIILLTLSQVFRAGER
jgi:lipopolysaccharide/colanic/teichoic acid biosynthesis glycosyltransferase